MDFLYGHLNKNSFPFFCISIFRIYSNKMFLFQWHDPGVDSAPSENEYQEHFLGVKAAGAWGWQPHHLHVPNAIKSGSLNLLEPSGLHRALLQDPKKEVYYHKHYEMV